MQPGTTVYLANGTEALYVGAMPEKEGRHVVSVPIYGGPDNDEIVDYETREVGEVHLAVPREKRNAEIVRLDTEISTKKQDLRDLEEMSKKSTQLVQTLSASYESLKRLDDFMAGRFSHVVKGRKINHDSAVDNIEILPFTESCQANSWGGEGKGIALMCLFGRAEGNLSWRLNEYRDGSGSWSVVIPCLSLDEAKQKSEELILSGLATITTDYSRLCDLLKSARTIGIAVPEKYTDARNRERKRRALEKIASLEQELETVRKKMEQ